MKSNLREAAVCRSKNQSAGCGSAFCGNASEKLGLGGGLRSCASGTIAPATTIANPSMVACQPNCVIPFSKTVGHSTPAIYCPDEINATAVPRRRSNQRLTEVTSGG
jgi:hypothetical protein